MDIPLYNSTNHPNDWLNQVQTKCILAGVKGDKEVLKLCKLNISKGIQIPDDINNVSDLVIALKNHPSFNIFKNDCKAKMDNMQFEGGDTAKFLADFRALCNNAEIINNPEDVRRRLLNTYASNEFFRNEFAKRVTRTTAVDDMFKIYSDVVSDEAKIIRYDSETSITIKHAATGKYLSSIEVNYQTGSERQVVFSGEKLPNENAAWTITCEKGENSPQAGRKDDYTENIVLYEDLIYMKHNKTECTLSLNDFYKSPKSGKAEVHCHRYIGSNLRCVKPNGSTNKTPYLKAGDTIYIKSENNTYTLSSHEGTFTIDDNSYQEVDGHREKVDKYDEWRIDIYRLDR